MNLIKKREWRFEEHWSGERAILEVGERRVLVKDMDGDSSYWCFKVSGVTVAAGHVHGMDDDFAAAIKQAEEAFDAWVL